MAWVKLKELAAHLGYSPRRTNDLIEAWSIPHVRPPKGPRLFNLDLVDEHLLDKFTADQSKKSQQDKQILDDLMKGLQ